MGNHTYAPCHYILRNVRKRAPVRIYTKKREVRPFFTLIKGFAIPAKSRKTTEVHARYATPTPPKQGVACITYPRGHSSLLSGLLAEFCEDSDESQTTSINAFFMSLLFYVGKRRHRLLKPLRMQRYCFFLTYARKIQKKVPRRRFFLIVNCAL